MQQLASLSDNNENKSSGKGEGNAGVEGVDALESSSINGDGVQNIAVIVSNTVNGDKKPGR